MINCPNCGFEIVPGPVIQPSLPTATSSHYLAEAPDVTVVMALRGVILRGIGKYSDYPMYDTPVSEVCAKITDSTFKALLVADEVAYANYNKTIAKTKQIFREIGGNWAEQSAADYIPPSHEDWCPVMGEAGSDCLCWTQEDLSYDSREWEREKVRSRVTQAAKEVSDEFAAHGGLEQYSHAINVAVTIGFAASEVMAYQPYGTWKTYDGLQVSHAIFDEFLASATAAVEEALADYNERGTRLRFRIKRTGIQDIDDDFDDLPF